MLTGRWCSAEPVQPAVGLDMAVEAGLDASGSRSWTSNVLIPGRFRARSRRCRSPGPRGATSGTTTATATRLRLAARQRLDRAPAPQSGCGDQISGQARTIGPPMAHETRSSWRGCLEVTPGPDDVVLHERRRGGQRERDQARALVHGPPQGDRPLSLLPRATGARSATGDPRRWPPARDPGRRADARPTPTAARQAPDPARSARGRRLEEILGEGRRTSPP